MAHSTSFEERLQRIGAERTGEPTPAKTTVPDEKSTNLLLFAGLAVVLILAVAVTIAGMMFNAAADLGTDPLTSDGWEPVVSKGVAVGDGNAERIDGNWQRRAIAD